MASKKSEHIFSYSQLKAFQRCRYRYHLQYERKLASPPSLGQKRGSAGHKALEYWYGTEKNVERAIEAAWNIYSQDQNIDQEDWELLQTILIRYFEWASKHDDFKAIATEWEFHLDLAGFNFMGYIDGIVEKSNGQVWLLEHKFQKRASTRHLDIDPQVSVYLLAALMNGYKPTGVMYNIVRVSNGPTAQKEPVLRTLVYRPIEGLDYFAQELVDQMSDASQFLEEERDRPPYRNLTSDCTWDCSFLKVCMELNDSGTAEDILGDFDER